MANFERWISANDVVNRAAVEVGLNPVNDAYATGDPSFQSLRFLLNSCGQELVDEFGWQQLEKSVSFTTASGDSGNYPLPADFGYMIDQTGWQKGAPNGAYPLLGPASAQWWSYLQAGHLADATIYAWFRIAQDQLMLWPQPPPVGIPIAYKYISRGWVIAGDQADTYRDTAQIPSDRIMYEPVLIVRKLKLAFLQAKGFDSTKAEDEYMTSLEAAKGHNVPAPILSLNRGYPGLRFMDGYTNVPETGYGP